VTLPGSGGTVNFKYDPFGRRIYKSSSSATSIYAYDGNNVVETVNASGGVVARYSQSENTDELLAMLRGTTTDYYEIDGVGSVSSLTDTTGALAQTYTYDSFGNTTNSSGSLTNFFRYTGREFDTETNIYFYRARYYDPNIGRFLSEDPLRFGPGDPNFYDYVSNNPVLYRDPSGRRRIYGNWCGPDWTGGLREPYNPAHAGIYKPPIDDIDTVCMHHDICYFNCRSSQPCSPTGRSKCMTKCDQVFVGEMPYGQGRGLHGMAADAIAAGIFWHQFHPDPGPNSGGCACSSGSNNQPFDPSIPLLRGLMLAHP
jgi:RHS repeat-associated protein